MNTRKSWTRCISPPDEISSTDCFETIKVEVNPSFGTFEDKNISLKNLKFHESRFIETCKALDLAPKRLLVPGVLNKLLPLPIIKELITETDAAPSLSYRLRMDYGSWGYALSLKSFFPRKIQRVGIIEIGDHSYQYKYRERSWIDEIRNRWMKYDEIILTKKGIVSDSLWSNCIFRDGQKWFSPKESLLKGTKRAYLHSLGLLEFKTIHQEELSSYKSMGFINALYDMGDLSFDPKKLELIDPTF